MSWTRCSDRESRIVDLQTVDLHVVGLQALDPQTADPQIADPRDPPNEHNEVHSVINSKFEIFLNLIPKLRELVHKRHTKVHYQYMVLPVHGLTIVYQFKRWYTGSAIM